MSSRNSGTMRKYYQLILIVVCVVSVITLLIYRHEYYRLRYVLEVLNFFGKPGLSEVEFCGPGFNATMLSEIVRNYSMEVREAPPLFQQIDDDFYSYSSYLSTINKQDKLTHSKMHIVYTIVIGKTLVRPNFRCNVWLENAAMPRAGRFKFKLVNEDKYNLYIFQCSLSHDLGKPLGVSFYVNNYNVTPTHVAINRIRQLDFKGRTKPHSSIRFVNDIQPAVCVLPNQIPLVSRDAIIEFLVFHQMMGVNHFTIYDSMVSEDIIRRLNMLPIDISKWTIQFFPLNYPFLFSKSYSTVRQAIEMDCLFRHFRVDKDDDSRVNYAITLSWDEFLVPRLHSNIKAVINDFDPKRKLQNIEMTPQIFCLNQNDDDNAETGYPDIMRKTHYYEIPKEQTTVFMKNVDSITSLNNIYSNFSRSDKNLPLDVLGVHKYTICSDLKTGEEFTADQMSLFRHKFEGAMMKFGGSLTSNTVYRLYRSGQIWEKHSNENDRDL